MTRPVQAQGRPGTPVIPADWQANHAPVIAKTLEAACSIRHPGVTSANFNRSTGRYDDAGAHPPHFTGPCRIESLSVPGARSVHVADEEIPTGGFLLVLEPHAAPEAAVDDLVAITSEGLNTDSTLVGVELVVTSIPRSSVAFSRVLICNENQS